MKNFYIALSVITISIISIFLLQALGLVSYSFFSPKYEEARRKTFEQTRSFTEGTRQELYNIQREYILANKEQKLLLKDVILHKTAGIDKNTLSQDLREFLESLK